MRGQPDDLVAAECKWSETAVGESRGLRAFKQVYPAATAVLVLPSVEREYTVGLGGSHTGRVTDLAGLIGRLAEAWRS